jgi:cytochrome c oxidase subunit II
MKLPLFPESASTISGQVDLLYLALVLLSLFFLAVIFLPLAWCLVRYRRANPADRRPLRMPTTVIEVTWTVIPLFMGLGIFAWGAVLYFHMAVPPTTALEINVVGKQWMWKIQHQEGNREINELHIPVGRTVKLTMASEDVIHSFFIPAFRTKQDVVPGRFTTEWFTPTKVGTYHLFCAEFCGADHSKMIGTVQVMKPADYEAWLTRGAVGDTLAQSGAKLFRELGCSGCHMGIGTVRAPRLEGVYGKLVPLQDGHLVRADDQYLRDSILLPASQVAAGYEPVMPTFQGRLTEEELLHLIAYLKSLANRAPEELR